MAETASETASSLQLVRTLINPNGVGRPRTEDDIEPAPTRRAPSPADSFGNEDADSNNDYEMGDVMSQDGVAEAATIATQVTQPPRSRVDFASESMSQARRPYSPMSQQQQSQQQQSQQQSQQQQRQQENIPLQRPQQSYQPQMQQPQKSNLKIFEQEEGSYYEPRNRTPPPHPGFEAHPAITEADTLRSKHTMLIELIYLKGQGAMLSKDYDIHDDVADIHFELMRQRNLVDCSQTVEQWMVYIIVGIYIVEWLNSFIGSPLYFSGVGEYMSKNIKSIRLPLQRCYHRYVHRPSNNPIWDVVKALLISLIAYHLQMMLLTNIAGPGTARNTNVAAPSNIMSMLPIIMSALGGGGSVSDTAAAPSAAGPSFFENFGNIFSAARTSTQPPAVQRQQTHVPFGAASNIFEELKMPPPPTSFNR